MSYLKLSNDGQFLISEDKIYFASENKSYFLNEIKLEKWIDIIFENSIFSLKNNLIELIDVNSYHRKIIYNLLSEISFNKKSKLILEYENKFGGKLLNESIELTENWLTDAWKWTKDNVVSTFKEFGTSAVKAGENLYRCISGQPCNPFFQDFRDMLMNPVGVSIETFLSLTPIGKLVPTVLWGILAIWDGYLLYTESPDASWVNFIISLAGCAYGKIAKMISNVFKGIKTAGMSLSQVIRTGMKTKSLSNYFVKLPKYFKNIQTAISGSLSILIKKLNFKWVNSAVSFIMNKLKEIGNIINQGNTLSVATKKATLSGASEIAQNKSIDYVTGNDKNSEVTYDDILKANKGRKLNYNNIDL